MDGVGEAQDNVLLTVTPPRIGNTIDEFEDFDYDPSILRVKCRHCGELIQFRPVGCIKEHELECKAKCNPCNAVFPPDPNKPPRRPMTPVPASSFTSPPRLPEEPESIYCEIAKPNIDQQLCVDARVLTWKELYKEYVRKALSKSDSTDSDNSSDSDSEEVSDEEEEEESTRRQPDANASVQLFELECDLELGAACRSLFLPDGSPAYGIRRNCLVYVVKILGRYYGELKMLENLYVVIMIIIAFYKARTDWALEAMRKRFTPEQVRRNKVIERIDELLKKVDECGSVVETDNLEKILRDEHKNNTLTADDLMGIYEPPLLLGTLFTEDNFIIDGDEILLLGNSDEGKELN